jgi:hypothetical protein
MAAVFDGDSVCLRHVQTRLPYVQVPGRGLDSIQQLAAELTA